MSCLSLFWYLQVILMGCLRRILTDKHFRFLSLSLLLAHTHTHNTPTYTLSLTHSDLITSTLTLCPFLSLFLNGILSVSLIQICKSLSFSLSLPLLLYHKHSNSLPIFSLSFSLSSSLTPPHTHYQQQKSTTTSNGHAFHLKPRHVTISHLVNRNLHRKTTFTLMQQPPS